jgi:hypothetical protein
MAKKLSEGRKAGSGRKPGTAKTLAEGRKVGSGRKKGSVSKTLADGRKIGSGRRKAGGVKGNGADEIVTPPKSENDQNNSDLINHHHHNHHHHGSMQSDLEHVSKLHLQSPGSTTDNNNIMFTSNNLQINQNSQNTNNSNQQIHDMTQPSIQYRDSIYSRVPIISPHESHQEQLHPLTFNQQIHGSAQASLSPPEMPSSIQDAKSRNNVSDLDAHQTMKLNAIAVELGDKMTQRHEELDNSILSYSSGHTSAESK